MKDALSKAHTAGEEDAVLPAAPTIGCIVNGGRLVGIRALGKDEPALLALPPIEPRWLVTSAPLS